MVYLGIRFLLIENMAALVQSLILRDFWDPQWENPVRMCITCDHSGVFTAGLQGTLLSFASYRTNHVDNILTINLFDFLSRPVTKYADVLVSLDSNWKRFYLWCDYKVIPVEKRGWKWVGRLVESELAFPEKVWWFTWATPVTVIATPSAVSTSSHLGCRVIISSVILWRT